MTTGQLVITTHQPLAAHREAGKGLGFRDSGALQQRQGPAASTEEHKRCLHPLAASKLNAPIAVGLAREVVDLTTGAQLQGTTALQILQIQPRQAAEIHIGASGDARRGHRLRCASPLHHQGHPLRQLGRVAAPLHASKSRQSAELLVALAQKRHIALPPDKADVGHRIEKSRGVELAALAQRGPKLQAALKSRINRQGLGGGNAAIGLLRRVVQLAIGGMAGAGVIGRCTALEGRPIETLQHQQPHGWIQLMQQRRQGGAHDSGAHQHRVVTISHACQLLGFN